jgi:hypothetical protein
MLAVGQLLIKKTIDQAQALEVPRLLMKKLSLSSAVLEDY